MPQKRTLDSGLRLVTEKQPYMSSCSVSVWIGTGARYEPRDINGISHFVEHMLFKGTEKWKTNQELSQAIESVGGLINGFTNKEVTCYLIKVPKEHISLGIEVLAQMVTRPLLREDDLERERGVIIEEIKMVRDKPDQWVHILLDEIMWPGQALGRSIAGTEDVIRSISRDAILEYVSRSYVFPNIVVSVAGNMEPGIIEDTVMSSFSKLEERYGAPYSKEPPRPGPSRAAVERRDTKQANLAIGLMAYSRQDPRRYALDLMNVAFGWGMSSRLFQEVRVKRGLAYAVGSAFGPYTDTGALRIFAGVDPGKSRDALAVILEELKKLKESGLSEEELNFAREFYKGNLALRLEDTLNLSIRMGESELLTGEILTLEDVIARVEKVTVEDVRAVAHDIIKRECLYIAACGPFEDQSKTTSEIEGLMEGF